MVDANLTVRHIRGVVRDIPDLHHAYLHNAAFHTAVNTACQATNERQAIRLLLDGMAIIARSNAALQNRLVEIAEAR